MMSWKNIFAALLLAAMLAMLSVAANAGAKAEDGKGKDAPAASAPASNVHSAAYTNADRLEGEKRFRENCARCHAAPPKFPPRMMGTIVRHMRVRATITDEDMRLILHYMTQ
jgi:mono/diheme cytochrome c family protein